MVSNRSTQPPARVPGAGLVSDIPAELRTLPQWVGWRLVQREKDKKPTKVPVDPKSGGPGDSTAPGTWGTFEEALSGAVAGKWDGVGFVFTKDDPYCGIDLDEVIDRTTNEIDADALAVIDRFATYGELSVSKEGIHLIVKGVPPVPGRKRGDRECYFHSRYFTFTGLRVTPHEIEQRQDVLVAWHGETFPTERAQSILAVPTRPLDLSDAELVEKIGHSRQGDKFRRLWAGDTTGYESGSEADLALCSVLAWWTQKNGTRVDSLFRSSGLMRAKWDARRGDTTYGGRTVAKAVDGLDGQYDPDWRPDPPQALVGPHVEPEVHDGDEDDVAGIEDLKRAGAEVRWVWPGWIQQGVLNAFAAQGGTGKTRLTADLVRRVRHGLCWPDGSPMNVRPGKTVALWVVADNHHDEMVTLCESFGIADCVKLNASKADPYAGVSLEVVEEFAALEKRVKATRPVFVVVDTVGNATDRNLSRQEDAKAFYQPLQIIARRQNVAILCLTHLNATGKVLGRRALEKVRTCIRMSAERVNDTGCPRRLEVIKSNSPYPDALGVVMGDAGNEYSLDAPPAPDDDRAEAKPPTKANECRDWLEPIVRATPKRVSELRSMAENAGFSTDALYKAKTLLKLEEVSIQGYKWWRVSVDAQNSN